MLSFSDHPARITFPSLVATLDPDGLECALLTAKILEAMHDIPQDCLPETHLATHLASLTDGHITFLHQEHRKIDVQGSPKEVTLSAAVVYGQRHYGRLHWRDAPDAIESARTLITYVADICGQALFAQHSKEMVHDVDALVLQNLPERLARLADLECATLLLLAQGKSVDAIGIAQGITVPTVRSRLQNIYFKLGVTGQFQAAYTGIIARMLGLFL